MLQDELPEQDTVFEPCSCGMMTPRANTFLFSCGSFWCLSLPPLGGTANVCLGPRFFLLKSDAIINHMLNTEFDRFQNSTDHVYRVKLCSTARAAFGFREPRENWQVVSWLSSLVSLSVAWSLFSPTLAVDCIQL